MGDYGNGAQKQAETAGKERFAHFHRMITVCRRRVQTRIVIE